jgi:hypothetical protein
MLEAADINPLPVNLGEYLGPNALIVARDPVERG